MEHILKTTALPHFVLIRDILYKRGFSRLYLRCLVPNETDYVMREVYEEVCGNHSRACSLVHKLVQAGYYWPTMHKNAQSYVKACDKCQHFSNIVRQPSKQLTAMNALWPFAEWGLDIIGPFPMAIRQLKFLKAFSVALGSLKSLFPIVESNLITKHSKIFANSWGLRTTTLHPPTHRPMDSLWLQTNHCSK